MTDLTPYAVPSSLAALEPVLPPPPATILEVGCGRGALAAALAECGWTVTGLEPDAESAAAARERGVTVVEQRLEDGLPDGTAYDVVLFTRSLHHVEDLELSVRTAARALRPGGVLVLEEFARDAIDRLGAAFLDDNLAVLEVLGLAMTRNHEPTDPAADPLDRWERERGRLSSHPLHTGGAMLAALPAAGLTGIRSTPTPTLWRLVCSRLDGDDDQVGAVARTLRATEIRRIAEGTLPALGMLVVATASAT